MTAKYTPARLSALAVTRRPTQEEERIVLAIARNTAARYHAGPAYQGLDRDDLLGEALLAAWKGFLTHDRSRGKLSSWLIACCRGAIQEALRRADPLSRTERERYRRALKTNPKATPPRVLFSLDAMFSTDPDQETDLAQIDALAAQEDETERLIERLEARTLAAAALSVIEKPAHRDAILKTRGEGASHQEAASLVGLSEAYVGNLFRMYRETMRAKVEGVR